MFYYNFIKLKKKYFFFFFKIKKKKKKKKILVLILLKLLGGGGGGGGGMPSDPPLEACVPVILGMVDSLAGPSPGCFRRPCSKRS